MGKLGIMGALPQTPHNTHNTQSPHITKPLTKLVRSTPSFSVLSFNFVKSPRLLTITNYSLLITNYYEAPSLNTPPHLHSVGPKPGDKFLLSPCADNYGSGVAIFQRKGSSENRRIE